MRRVKALALLMMSACPLPAALLAHVETTRGTVTVELQFTTAPQAVANFMTLAQGTRPWVDPVSGEIRTDPYYDGIKIHRTSNTTSFKFAQGGSRKGDGSDGPGYTFKDEFGGGLTHVPYVFSLANAGPNTNGAQFFFTGSISQPSFNNVHTIAGLVSDPASRTVVDAIIAAGTNGTTIVGVTFQRTDAAAIAFDELAQNLPLVSSASGSLRVFPGDRVDWDFQSPLSTGSIFRVFRSTSLTAESWAESGDRRVHAGIGGPGVSTSIGSTLIDGGDSPSAFYRLTTAVHPGAVAPATLANRTVSFQIGGDLFTYAFNETESGGTATFTPAGGSASTFSFTRLNGSTGAHDVNFIADHDPASPLVRYFLVKVGCESATSTVVAGRHSTSIFNGVWVPVGSGPATITR
jgi:peptidyl-prolyl cis-trans isomerase A (cyclophilin A)